MNETRRTREAYHRALSDFFAWLDDRDVPLIDIEPVIVAAFNDKAPSLGGGAFRQGLLPYILSDRHHRLFGEWWHDRKRPS